MIVPKIKSEVINESKIFGSLLKSRDIIHLSHLSTKSYAKHKALGEFYEDIVDLTDSLIESYQGKYGIVDIIIPESKIEDPIKYLEYLSNLIDVKAKSVFKDSWILNQLDEISKLIYSTLYKLKNLS